jgi:hypothetical protein
VNSLGIRPPFGNDSTVERGYGDTLGKHYEMDTAMKQDREWPKMSGLGRVSRGSPVHTAVRNCTRDERGPFEVGNQVLISSHRKLLSSKAMVVNVAEKSERDFGRHD